MIVRTIDIRLEPLCERTSGMINKLELILTVTGPIESIKKSVE